jgi:anti-anti-sigma regulatory factor
MLVLQGEVDLHVAEQVRAALAVVAACPVRHLSVELAGTEFVSLGVLSELAEAGRALAGRGGSWTLSGARPVQRRVLELLDVPPSVVLADRVEG